MAHFARIENNIVQQVIVVNNEVLLDSNGIEQELIGSQFCTNLFGGEWIQTSYNNKFRGIFAEPGYFYDSKNDIFCKETPAKAHLYPWNGETIINKPSILFDSAPRSANLWSIALLNQAFPNAYQRWGYPVQHSLESFKEKTNNFDAVITTLRNPIDALASEIVSFKIDINDNEKIIKIIKLHTNILQSILDNKNNIIIFSFEGITQHPEDVIKIIESILNINSEPFNEEELLKSISNFTSIDNKHHLPIENNDKISLAKSKLSEEVFADLINKVNDLYTTLIKFKKL
jgi:hypothetical protein